MSNFSCCLLWFLGGLLAGFLLWQLFDKFFRRDGDEAGARWKRDLDAANIKANGYQADLSGANSKFAKLQGDFDSGKSALSAKADEAMLLSAEVADLRAKLSLTESKAQTSSAAAVAASAAALAAGALASAGSFGFVPQKNGVDDLIIIEGIGPKIKELLHAAGITTFAQLASAPIARVQEVLDAAGPNFRLANPASWAKQSDLCARGDWAALRKLQDELSAGVDPNAPKA